jgi:hypothetical protein
MAGDWIKIQHATCDKPEMSVIAERLGIDPDAVLGKCVRFWVWLDAQSRNGHALRVTKMGIDRVVFVTGFADALIEVGWLEHDGELFNVPNFDMHNGKTAKHRALGNARQKVSRSCHAPSVTKTPSERDKIVTREEKRREEITRKKETRPRKQFQAPTLPELTAYCREKGYQWDPQHMLDHFTANGWKQSNGNAIKDWKAAARTWERNNQKFEGKATNGQRTARRGQLSTAQRREESNADAFAAVFGTGDGVTGAVLNEDTGPVHSAPVGHMGGGAGAVPYRHDQPGGADAGAVHRPVPRLVEGGEAM